MTAEQKAAFIIAQAAISMATVAAMQAENNHQLTIGQGVKYKEAEFSAAANEAVLGHNAVIEFFRE